MTGGEIRDEIGRLNDNFMETFRRGDAAGMGELYTEDGQLLPPNGDFTRGPQAIGRFWGGAMEAGVRSIRLGNGEVEQHGNTAVEVNTATLHGTNDEVLDEVKYIIVWKRENGEWKIHRDIYNSSRPAS
jgi:uncharacterized protein (TIGR02246 family)